MEYAGFWRRFGAYWIDFIVLLPLMAIGVFGTNLSRWFQPIWLIPGTIIGLWFSVYLVIRHGGTPGKLLMGTRIVMEDGSAVTTRAALVRHSVLFALSFLTSAALAYAAAIAPDEPYHSLTFVQKSMLLTELAPSWYGAVNVLLQVWVWSEFIAILCNKKKKALHDYMAGTVVVRRPRLQG